MTEEEQWISIDPQDMWVLDKLIVARMMGHVAGPVGISVPRPDWYVVRPAVNALGLGIGAERRWLTGNTDTLTPGHFWCEWFEGRHLSIDYHYGEQQLAVEGFKPDTTFIRWAEWKRVEDVISLPLMLQHLATKHEWINCEYIGGNLIEVHLRGNQDFIGNIDHFIPVWDGESTVPPDQYEYLDYPDIHGRIGAFIRRQDLTIQYHTLLQNQM